MPDRNQGGASAPRSWWRRYWWVPVTLGVVVIVPAILGLVALVSGPPLCGNGLTAEGTPQVCIGIDIDSGALAHGDRLADLETKTAALNANVKGGDFGTIVLLMNMTPDPNSDSVAFLSLRHQIEGAITAVWRADNQTVAGGTTPPIKLMLANFGAGANYWQDAVDAITAQQNGQHIVAVTGIGQSLDNTRQAVNALSEAGIVTVGAAVTADNMNQWPDDIRIRDFFRVASTNTDMATTAVAYAASHHYARTMLVKDTNDTDSYASTLGTAFTNAYTTRYHTAVPYVEPYLSPDGPLSTMSREQYMANQFAGMHADICQDKPDLFYFAGRGTDLAAFLTSLAQGGACGLTSVTVMSGDDATSLEGAPLPNFGDLKVTVLYTSESSGTEWQGFPNGSDQVQNYNQFSEAFGRNGFAPADLQDGDAAISHDAVLSAATAARLDPVATTNPGTVAASFLRFACRRTIPGASGDIAFDQNGNPVDKAMPIMRVQSDGSVVQQDLAWSTGQAFDPAACP